MMLLTPEQKDKYDFCRTTLTELLRKALHNEHYRADYYVTDHRLEFVEVSFDNEYTICKINVTGDSLLAMVRDVLRRF